MKRIAGEVPRESHTVSGVDIRQPPEAEVSLSSLARFPATVRVVCEITIPYLSIITCPHVQ